MNPPRDERPSLPPGRPYVMGGRREPMTSERAQLLLLQAKVLFYAASAFVLVCVGVAALAASLGQLQR